MLRSLPYWVYFAIPIATVLGLHAGGAWSVAGLVFVFLFVPLLEQLLGLRAQARALLAGLEKVLGPPED